MKKILIFLGLFLSVIMISCRKNTADTTPQDDGPFKVKKMLQLGDNIPWKELGGGKILFERKFSIGLSSFYVIDADKISTSGFVLGSSITDPAISPDGTKIACSLLNSAVSNAVWNIYIMNLDGSGCFPAYVSDQPAYYPTWNKDGSKIIYYTGGSESKLFMQSPVENSSDRTEILNFHPASNPEWSIVTDGAFTITPAGKIIGVSTSANPNGIISIDPNAGESGVKVILNPTTDLSFVSPNFRAESPVISPDGTKICFLSIYSNPLEPLWISVGVTVIDPDGGNVVPFGGMGGYLPANSNTRYVSACWSPDMTKILFAIPDATNASHLFLFNIDDSSILQVTDAANVTDCNVSWTK
jgi:Tol biopolymer transport system component